MRVANWETGLAMVSLLGEVLSLLHNMGSKEEQFQLD
jgi:hypothetical protein